MKTPNPNNNLKIKPNLMKSEEIKNLFVQSLNNAF